MNLDKRNLVFLCGLVILLCAKLSMVAMPMMYRHSPSSPDDSYAYILKTEVLRFGPDNMSGLKDLKQQLVAVPGDSYKTFINHKNYIRMVIQYHVLHSLSLEALRNLGLTQEQAYKTVEILGILFICIAAAYWLSRMFGTVGAGVAMLLLACCHFPDHGVNCVVPSTLALGIAMLTWGVIISRKRFSGFMMLVCIAAMLAMHPIGRLYSLAALAIFLLTRKQVFSFKTLSTLSVGLFLVILAFILPVFLTGQESWGESKDPLGFLTNIRPAVELFLSWTNYYGGYLGTALLIIIGFLSCHKKQKNDVLITAGTMILLLLAGIVYVIPNYPAHLFGRLMAPAGIFLSGLIATSLLSMIAVAWPSSVTNSYAGDFVSRLSSALGIRIFKPVVCILLVILISYNISLGSIKTFRIISNKLTLEQRFFDISQTETMLNLTDNNSKILYDADDSMFFYFAKGAMKRHAVHYFAVKDTHNEAKWLSDEKIDYVVGYNRIKEGRIRLSSGKKITVSMDSSCLLDSLFLNVNNPGRQCTININMADSSGKNIGSCLLTVPAGHSGWLQCACRGSTLCGSFTLTVNDGYADIFGLRTSDDLELNWPWDQGFAISYTNAFGEQKTARFSTSDGYYPDIGCKYKVIADKGTSLLLEPNYK